MVHQPLLFEAQAAVQRGDRDRAYHLLCQMIVADPQNVLAWLEMSKLVDDIGRKIECLERALRLEPHNRATQAGLEQLRTIQRMNPVRAAQTSLAPLAESTATSYTQLGTRLVNQGLLTSEQLDEALWEQNQRRRRGEHVRLGTILLNRGWVNPRTLARALVAQLQESRSLPQARSPRFLGEYLLVQGIITPEELQVALELQLRMYVRGQQIPLGSLLVRKGILTWDTLRHTLIQQESDLRLLAS
jgi:hypothetical protein